MPKSLLPRGGLNALFLAAPLPLLKLSPTPRRRIWGGNTSSTPLHGPAARRSARELLQKRCARGNATPLFSIFHLELAQIV